MRALTLFSLLLAAACVPTRAPAPEDLDGLLHFLYQNHEDPEAVVDGLTNLGEWLEVEGRTEEAREGWRVTPLTEEVVADVDRPPGDLDEAQGVAVAAVSPFSIEAHAAAIVLEDQIYTDPGSYDRYVRHLVEGDPAAFTDAAGHVRTENDIDKTTVNVTIPYWLYKDFQWVDLDDGRRAILSRSWIAEGSCGQQGNNCLHQSYSVDLWYADTAEDTLRLTSTWNDVESVIDAFLTEDQKVAVAVNGMLAIFESTDDFLEDEGF